MIPQALTTGFAAALAAGGYVYAALWPRSQLFGPALIAPRRPGEIALTFDDGPNDPWTGHLMEVLDRYNVRATFFVMGEYVRQRPGMVRRLAEAGHLVGNHTTTHPKLLYSAPARVRQELLDCNRAIEDATGKQTAFFRPPFGARRPDVLRAARELGLEPVLWNAMTHDWNAPSAGYIAEKITRFARGNQRRGYASNIVLHDGSHLGMGADRSRSVTAADMLLSTFCQSHRFVTLDAWAS